MPVRACVLTSFYRDSVVLMRVADEVRRRPGVREAALFMGTPANLGLLEQAGLLEAEGRRARPEDLVVAVDADSGEIVATALAAAQALLLARRHTRDGPRRARPRTLESAVRALPDANLAAISVPGAFAGREAMRALRRGLHVFLFSDNVPLADEVVLKQEARRRGLLCMGPDCGTAYVGGVGLGFANVVDRGRIGCVAASGTGLQAVACHLAALGEGISQGIGVGGRDLSAEVGAEMTCFGLEALAGDPGTAVIVLVSKPPHPDVLARLDAALAAVRKPVVVCALGLPARPRGDSVRWVSTLVDAAEAAAALASGRAWTSQPFADPRAAGRRLDRCRTAGLPGGPGILGLYTGGTLAHEARFVLEPLVGAVSLGDGAGAGPSSHRVLDLGDDAHTVGRPHPMIDADRPSRADLRRWRRHGGGRGAPRRRPRPGRAPRPGGPRRGGRGESSSARGRAGPSPRGGRLGHRSAARPAGARRPGRAARGRGRGGAAEQRRGGPLRGPAPPAGAGRHPPRAGGVTVPDVFGGPLRVVNLGLELFADTLEAAGVEVIHVDWRPPAGGDLRLAALLAALDDEAEPPEEPISPS